MGGKLISFNKHYLFCSRSFLYVITIETRFLSSKKAVEKEGKCIFRDWNHPFVSGHSSIQHKIEKNP